MAFDAKLQSGIRWVAVSPPDGSSVLTLVAPKPESKEHNLIGRTTGVVLITEDVLQNYRDWSHKGVRFHYPPRLRRVKYDRQPAAFPSGNLPSALWGGVFTRFKDVDGNTFELISFDEVTRDVEAQRRTIAEKAEVERRAAQELEIKTICRAACSRRCCPRYPLSSTRASAYRPVRSEATITISSIWATAVSRSSSATLPERGWRRRCSWRICRQACEVCVRS